MERELKIINLPWNAIKLIPVTVNVYHLTADYPNPTLSPKPWQYSCKYSNLYVLILLNTWFQAYSDKMTTDSGLKPNMNNYVIKLSIFFCILQLFWIKFPCFILLQTWFLFLKPLFILFVNLGTCAAVQLLVTIQMPLQIAGWLADCDPVSW